MSQSSFLDAPAKEPVTWVPSSAAAQVRLQHFLPKAGKAYAQQRNFDYGADDRRNVSALSPWIRHRLLLEDDVLRATLQRHSASAADKFIAEVFWRGYFKGWLEHHPNVWARYKQNLVSLVDRLESDAALARRYEEAVGGRTGIACFDTWAEELTEKGFLHNHARMWFASIWIFTLKLPWELGADFFYRHLLDGDPASNTCSWRWVGGLHTQGKTYLARASNIEKYTDARFNPDGHLITEAPALTEPDLRAPTPVTFPSDEMPGNRIGLLITEEDCSPETLPLSVSPVAVLALSSVTERSVLPLGDLAKVFAPSGVVDAATRAEEYFSCDVQTTKEENWSALLEDWTNGHALDALVTARLPIGPVTKRLKSATRDLSVPLIEITRDYDRAVWPYAKRGFFGLRKKMPHILAETGLA
ncbi:MAG: FAD-binding domain-containing protein [Pseudomonadota bacterium]